MRVAWGGAEASVAEEGVVPPELVPTRGEDELAEGAVRCTVDEAFGVFAGSLVREITPPAGDGNVSDVSNSSIITEEVVEEEMGLFGSLVALSDEELEGYIQEARAAALNGALVGKFSQMRAQVAEMVDALVAEVSFKLNLGPNRSTLKP